MKKRYALATLMALGLAGCFYDSKEGQRPEEGEPDSPESTGDESPYQACKIDKDCNGGSICINSTLNPVLNGNFCSPACDEKMECLPAADNVEALGAECSLSNMGAKVRCAITCDPEDPHADSCGPSSKCETLEGFGFSICTHP